jgi:hypothetical protein
MLTEASQIIGFLSIIQAGIMISISMIVYKKSRELKSRVLLYLFIFIYFSSSTLFPFMAGYIYWLVSLVVETGPLPSIPPYTFYAYLGTFLIPVSFIGWTLVYLSLSSYSTMWKKITLSLIIIFSICYEIYLVYFLFISPIAPEIEMVGVLIERADFSLRGFVSFYVITMIIWNLISGIQFSIKGIKTGAGLAKLKGKIILFAFIFMFLETIIEGYVLSGEGNLILERIIGGILDITSFLLLYIGFLLPKWFQKLFKLEES